MSKYFKNVKSYNELKSTYKELLKAKQLRLRDIGGIIIIDYIDMENQETKQKILKVLEESVKKDRSKIQIVGFTPLDLLEMTRKHICSND